MMPVFTFVLELVVSLFATAWVVRRDMRSLDPEHYRRSWNAASFWSAVVAFGPLCIPVHFIRTRRSLWGALLGVAWTAAVLAVTSLASWLLEFAAQALATS
jgi:hypothetical protein